MVLLDSLFRTVQNMRKKNSLRRKMYESSCSYQGGLELKRSASAACPLGIKTEEITAPDWSAYRFCNPSTFEQLKQSVEKAKAALQDRTGFLGTGSAFSDLYSGVASVKSQDSLQDNVRLRETCDDLKRVQGFHSYAHPINGMLFYCLLIIPVSMNLLIVPLMYWYIDSNLD